MMVTLFLSCLWPYLHEIWHEGRLKRAPIQVVKAVPVWQLEHPIDKTPGEGQAPGKL